VVVVVERLWMEEVVVELSEEAAVWAVVRRQRVEGGLLKWLAEHTDLRRICHAEAVSAYHKQ